MSLEYLEKAARSGDVATLIRYVHLHLGDGNEDVGKREVDKAWIEALKLLLDVPATDQTFIQDVIRERDPATLAHLFFYLHFYLVRHSGEWIHDGAL